MILKVGYMKNKKKIVVFASGSGTNFINIYKNIKNGIVVLLISNNSKCGAVEYARTNSIDYKIINKVRYPDALKKEYEIVLNYHKPDLILLAGFMKKIPLNVIKIYKNKIMNIHPSLLPKYGGKGFYGIKVHDAVLKSKDEITGATVHFVDSEYDRGPIIMQKEIHVDCKADDALTLSKKVLEIEYYLYLKVVELFCNDKIYVDKNKVIINE